MTYAYDAQDKLHCAPSARAQRWAIELPEEHAPAHAGPLRRAVVVGVDAGRESRFEIGEREEGLVTERSQDPALGDLDAHLGLRFVLRPDDAGGAQHRAVVVRQFTSD